LFEKINPVKMKGILIMLMMVFTIVFGVSAQRNEVDSIRLDADTLVQSSSFMEILPLLNFLKDNPFEIFSTRGFEDEDPNALVRERIEKEEIYNTLGQRVYGELQKNKIYFIKIVDGETKAIIKISRLIVL
jgi:hypothetical protein